MDAANRSCAPAGFGDSILRAKTPKILLQQYPADNRHSRLSPLRPMGANSGRAGDRARSFLHLCNPYLCGPDGAAYLATMSVMLKSSIQKRSCEARSFTRSTTMLRVKAAINTKDARVIGFFIFSTLQSAGVLTPMSPCCDDAPPHTWLEMPLDYGDDASALSSMAWQVRFDTAVHLVPASGQLVSGLAPMRLASHDSG